MAERLWKVEARVNQDIERRSGDRRTPSPHLAYEPKYQAPATRGRRDTASARHTTHTDKPAADPEKAHPVNPALVPGSTGSSGSDEDDTIYGYANDDIGSFVTVRAGFFDDVDASVGYLTIVSGLGPTVKQIQQAVTDCIDEIFGTNERGLRVTNMNFAVSGIHNGSLTIEIATSRDFELTGRITREELVVHTDAKSFSGKGLADKQREIHPNDPRETLVAYTPPGGQTKNYLANDLSRRPNAGLETGLEKILWIDLAGQIHELGNSLSARFGQRSPPKKYHDRDSGMTVEDCVYKRLKK